MNLSPHFTSEEFARTNIRRFILPNLAEFEGNARAVSAARVLCTDFMEPLRAHFGQPVIVHSGFRGADLNRAVGGVKGSQHWKGEALDFHVVGHSLQAVFDWIRNESGFEFGQVILEGAPSWIHLSLGEPFREIGRCREVFRAVPNSAGEMVYSRVR